MNITIFAQGIWLGFAITAMIGPVGILCVKQSISDGFWAGIATGLGATIAYMLFSLLTALGIATISDFLHQISWQLQLFGSAYLMYIGYSIFHSTTTISTTTLKNKNLFPYFLSSFLLTITNPITLLTFIFLFSSFITESINFYTTFLLSIGVGIGSLSCWALLSWLGAFLQQRITSVSILSWINKISGIIIASFGIALLLKIFFAGF